jgi:hypothetical protein
MNYLVKACKDIETNVLSQQNFNFDFKSATANIDILRFILKWSYTENDSTVKLDHVHTMKAYEEMKI